MKASWKQYLKPNNALFWICFALVCRFVLSQIFAGLLIELQSDQHFLFDFIFIHPDYVYFLHPVDLFFEKGIMTYDGHTAFAGRMPGYSFPYLVLRFIFDKPYALLSLILLQIGMAGAAVYALAKIAFDWFKSNTAFYWVFAIALFSPLLAVYDYQTITESFSISCFILHLYFLHKALKYKVGRYFLFSGIFIAWAVFLRPFLGVALMVSGLLLVFEWAKSRLRFKQLVLFAAAFIVFESAWIIRNYSTSGKFIPLESGLTSYGKIYSPGYQKLRELLYRLGEETAYVDPGMAQWMRSSSAEYQSKHIYNENTVPTLQDLHTLRHFYLSSRLLEQEAFEKADKELIDKVQIQLDSLRSADAFRFFFAGPLNGLKKLWLHSGSAYMPFPPFQEMNLIQKSIKLFSAGLYYLILLLGVFGLLRLKLGFVYKVYFLSFPVLLSIALVVVSSIQEARYVVTVFPILLILSAGVLSNFTKLQQRGSEN